MDTYMVLACVDCSMLIANGETPVDMGEGETADYLDRVATHSSGYWWSVGEEAGFSFYPCGVCGSDLGGDRHEAAGFPHDH